MKQTNKLIQKLMGGILIIIPFFLQNCVSRDIANGYIENHKICNDSLDDNQPGIQHQKSISCTEVDSSFVEILGTLEKLQLENKENVKLEDIKNIFSRILSYLSYNEIVNLKQVDKFFYHLITGYPSPGKIGIEHAPDRLIEPIEAFKINKSVDFKNLDPKTIPSVAFYQLIREVYKFPKVFWPYLRETNIHTVSLWDNNLSRGEIVEFIKHLRYTNVHTVNLRHNNIDAITAEEIFKYLPETCVHTINLSQNNLGPKGAKKISKSLKDTNVHVINLGNNHMKMVGAVKFAKNLQGTRVRSVELWGNAVGEEGAVEFVKNLKDTQVHIIDLSLNNLGAKGAIEVVKHLVETDIHTINLGNNRIEDDKDKIESPLAEIARNLQVTKVHTIDLSGNNIGDKEAIQFAKNLKGTKVRTIDLSYNNIRSEGIVEFAKHLQGTEVKEVHLGANNIYPRTKQLLKRRYPHIKWVFPTP